MGDEQGKMFAKFANIRKMYYLYPQDVNAKWQHHYLQHH